MKVILSGTEFKCHSFTDLAVGTVFGTDQGMFIKTAQAACFNLCSGTVEAYNGLAVTPYPDAELILDPEV